MTISLISIGTLKKFSWFTQVLALLVFFAVLYAPPASPSERIIEMNVTGTVRRDASLTITEDIRVQAEGAEIRRGIIRVVPTEYTGEDKKRHNTEFSLVSATIDGRETRAEVTRSGGNVEIRVGNPETLLSRGAHSIGLTYKTLGWIAFRESFDEIYWNVSGTDWPFSIDHVSFRLVLPEGASVSKMTAFTGGYGTTGGSYEINPEGVIATTRTLAPGEGFTVALAWNKGVVIQPLKPKGGVLRRLMSGRSVLVGFLVALVVLYYFGAWYLLGRDPGPGRVIPLYRPPRDIEPGFARYLRDMKFSHDVLAADIIQLAVLGFLTFHEANGVLRIEPTPKATGPEGANRLDELSVPLRLLIKEFSTEVLKRGGVVVNEVYGYVFKNAEETLRGEYEQMGREYFNLNSGYSLAGMIFFLPFIFLAPWTWPRLISLVRSLTMGVPASGVILARFYLRLAAFSRKMLKLLMVFLGVLGAMFAVAGIIDLFKSDLFFLCGLIIAAAAALFFSRIMSARTEKGARVMAEIDGLAMYMGTAERYRLAMINPPEQTPKLFEVLLPYAFALGCSETWAGSFAEILRKASYKPEWDRTFNWNDIRPWRPSLRLFNDFSKAVDS
ncbi:MAG: DUF2207 domain-containing protein, partial [Synergistaceae bacterium]|nr:DUF2207 domain-containing protein [Synergistaceae bacterium]